MIVVDDESGDVEGNLIMAATFTSPRDVAFMVKHGSGIVSVGMKEEDLQRLKLPLMSPDTEDEDSSAPTFTITVVPSLGDSYFLGLYKFTAPCIYILPYKLEVCIRPIFRYLNVSCLPD